MLKAFLSYRFNPTGETFAARVARHLQRMEIETVDGKQSRSGEGLDGQIQRLIDGCHFLVSVRTEIDASQYLSTESGYARGRGMPVVIIAADGVPVGGLDQSDLHIRWTGDGFEAASDLMHAVNEIKFQLGASLGPPIAEATSEAVIVEESWPPEVQGAILEYRALQLASKYQRALEKASELYASHPECWRAALAISACNILLEQFDPAEEILYRMLRTYPANSRALSHIYQNLGWLNSEQCEHGNAHPPAEVERRIKFYRESIRHEPRIAVYLNLIMNLLRLNLVDEAEGELLNCLLEFPTAKSDFVRFAQAQGTDFLQVIRKSTRVAAVVERTRTRDG